MSQLSEALKCSYLLVSLPCVLQVAVLAKQILDKDLTDRKKTSELDIGPYVGGSYNQLASTELERRIKQVSTAFYRTPPTKLFGSHGASEFSAWAFWVFYTNPSLDMTSNYFTTASLSHMSEATKR